MHRRDFLRTALALPAAGVFAAYDRLTAADLGKVRITDLKMRPSSSHTMIRIDTDAGISGYGESGVTFPMMQAWMERYKPLLLKQDPLAIQTHWMRMSTLMHTYMASVPALSGIDMALWDLAGKLTGLPVYRLLGGPFRDEVSIFINSEPRNMLDKKMVKDWADQFRANPQGFRAAKINTHGILGIPMGRYTTSVSAQNLHRLRTGFENVREELGLDYDIMVHCHNEYDLPTAKAIARAVEGIEPKWFEDPLPPPFSDAWVALKRECRVPLLTGEKVEMPQGFYPFLREQAVDYIYPDIAFCGGITSFMKIAAIAALHRIPMATHNVGGIWLTMASIHAGLSIHDFLTSEASMGGPGGGVLALAKNPPVVKGGLASRPETPGLGVELNEEAFRQRQGGRGGAGQPVDWV
ncbi:MAG: mandelate racemase/muconate lactonizing enzyme family protein [Bryobacterales bacterium]|nr:mandelate racemase/muconate lactonizing enzyme family protein [Bryobacterales bacterium]